MAVTMDVNKYLEVVGSMGRYQWLMFILVSLAVGQFGWESFMVIFTHNLPDFRCADDELGLSLTPNITFDNKCETTSVVNNITVTRRCKNFVYNNTEHGVTAIEQFNLICDMNYVSTIIEMSCLAVSPIGMIGGSYLSDRYGRKYLCALPLLLTSVFGLVQAFSVNVIMYSTTKVLCSITSSAIYSPACALVAESVATRTRPHILNGLGVAWVLGTSSLSLIAYLFKSWWKTQLFCSCVGLPLGIVYIWLLNESPHWLASRNRITEALAILQKMAKWNSVSMDGLSYDINSYSSEEADTKNINEREGFLKVWTHKRLVGRFMVISYAWVVCSICYFALSFGVRELPGSIYLNNLFSCAVEGIAYAICFCIAWWGRKWPTVSSFMGGSAALLVMTLLLDLVPDVGWAITTMSLLGKMCVTASWQITIIWGMELYPTTHRCMLAALNSLIGRLGGVLAPLLLDLDRFIDVPKEELIMPIIFVILMVAGGFLHLIPPETNNRVLPEFIKDANQAEFPLVPAADSLQSEGDDKFVNETERDLLEPEHREQNV